MARMGRTSVSVYWTWREISSVREQRQTAREQTYQVDSHHGHEEGQTEQHGTPSGHFELWILLRALEERRAIFEAATGDVLNHFWDKYREDEIKSILQALLVVLRTVWFKERRKKGW